MRSTLARQFIMKPGAVDVYKFAGVTGERSRHSHSFKPTRWQLDGWVHKTYNNNDTGVESHYRIPAPVDPVNWRPLSTEESELFYKRLEKGAKVIKARSYTFYKRI